jgi:mono/diheme cytochrome c family protein
MKSERKISQVNRESEPSVGFAPVPVVLFLLFGALFFAGQLYLDHYGGGFQAEVYQPYSSWKMVQDLQPKGEGDVLFAKGKKIFSDVGCVACHQANGMGVAGQFPPLAGSEWVLAPGPNRIIRIAQNGLEGPITVKGTTWSLAMPSGLTANLSDEDFAALMTFVRGNKEWGNNASPVTPAEIKAVRDQTKDRQTPWHAEELLAIPEK